MGSRRGQGLRHVIIGWAVGIAGVVLLAAPGSAGLIVTEVMYNPQVEPTGEWVEVYNNGSTAISMQGWVLDDMSSIVRLSQSNISGGTIPAGGVAVLYNGLTSASSFTAAWGNDINLIPVTSWQALNNDRIDGPMLWQSFSSYSANGLPDTALGYGISSSWPAPVEGRSIYYNAATPDAGLSANWKVSAVGVAGAYLSNGNDVGSPGVVPIPEPSALWWLPLAGLAALGCRWRRLADEPFVPGAC